ncbi:hypothetical protein BPUN_2836 [Candidatus Paraburkholderia kirkii]|nr:hypothetical protein BPUN_2836 [Candidatus Paraburkholderia kirkii]
MGAGGPVLVWPREHAPGPLDGTAVIAWDGSREAARAVFDALLLRRTKHVDIVSIRVERDAPLADGRAAPDLARSLMRHAVIVNVVGLAVGDKAHVDPALMSYLQVRARTAFGHGRVSSQPPARSIPRRFDAGRAARRECPGADVELMLRACTVQPGVQRSRSASVN